MRIHCLPLCSFCTYDDQCVSDNHSPHQEMPQHIQAVDRQQGCGRLGILLQVNSIICVHICRILLQGYFGRKPTHLFRISVWMYCVTLQYIFPDSDKIANLSSDWFQHSTVYCCVHLPQIHFSILIWTQSNSSDFFHPWIRPQKAI